MVSFEVKGGKEEASRLVEVRKLFSYPTVAFLNRAENSGMPAKNVVNWKKNQTNKQTNKLNEVTRDWEMIR